MKKLLAFVLALGALLVVTGCKTSSLRQSSRNNLLKASQQSKGRKNGEGDLVFISSADKENCRVPQESLRR